MGEKCHWRLNERMRKSLAKIKDATAYQRDHPPDLNEFYKKFKVYDLCHPI